MERITMKKRKESKATILHHRHTPSAEMANFRDVVGKVIFKIQKTMEDLMQGQTDVENAIVSATASLAALNDAVSKLPSPADLTNQVTEINALTSQIDALTQKLKALMPA